MSQTSYLRLDPLPFSSLPSHPALNNQEDEQQDTLKTFLRSILNEASELISSTLKNPQAFKPDRKLRTSAPSTAKVQLFTSPSTNNSGHEKDYWVCRKSIHADLAQKGSASWSEFEKGLRENHSENEMDYTPTVASVEHLLQWPVIDVLEGGWKGVDMHVNMITHTFKPDGLISPRTFISLIISAYEPTSSTSAAAENGSEQPLQGFYTVQIPISFKDSQDLPASLKQQISSAAPKNAIFAHYASVERVRLLPAAKDSHANPNTAAENSNRRIEWIMATTSDAGGRIPQWVQRSWTMGGVPKAVVADVGLFLGWADRKRRS